MSGNKRAGSSGDRPIVFNKEFTRQEPLPEAGIRRAVELMQSGRLHRYNTAPGEISDVSLLESEYAEYVGSRYCLGLNSCGSALYVALKSAGVTAREKVLCNVFTLAPVPGAIENAGAVPVFVEIDDDYLIDTIDLERKAAQSGAQYLLLSHMRGHIADMSRVQDICHKHGITLIEDCAHTMGCGWGAKSIGTFGVAGCFSTQTYKHVNSGEGGLLVSDDDEIMAKAILFSGSYMLYDRHVSRPGDDIFRRYRTQIPNYSLRMSNLTAALIRAQLHELDHRRVRWNERYECIAAALSAAPHIRMPKRRENERYIGSSMQFSLTKCAVEDAMEFVRTCGERGVELKWFGNPEPVGFTSTWESWKYIDAAQELPRTRGILDFLCDFRISLTFTLDDCETIGAVLRQVSEEVLGAD